MATYSVTVNVDQQHVAQFNKQGWKLCFAAGVDDGTGDPKYNVVAQAEHVASHVIISWTEKYAIAATDSSFSNGVTFNINTDPINITFGESYTQPADWENGTVNTDSAAPKNGFLFINQAPKAAAVVEKVVNGTLAPIYVSQGAPLPPGTETLIPKVSCMLWFQENARTGTMISTFNTDSLALDLTDNQSHQAVVSYRADGTWTINKNN